MRQKPAPKSNTTLTQSAKRTTAPGAKVVESFSDSKKLVWQDDPVVAQEAFAEAKSFYDAEDLTRARVLFVKAINADSKNQRYPQRLRYLDEEIQDLQIKKDRMQQNARDGSLSMEDRYEFARLSYLLGFRSEAFALWQDVAENGQGDVAKAARKQLQKRQY